MRERWRQPVVPIAIEEDHPEGIWLPDGRVQGGVRLTLKPTDIERLRAGFVCLKCFEPFERSWPERCPVCGLYVRREQAAFFAREFGGTVPVYTGVDLDDELEQLHERAREEEMQ